MISIYNSNANLVQISTISNQQIDISTLSNGLFYFKINSENKIWVGKFIKQNL
ncbi:MAG: T9SS type A sorting domain-containing protein [Saprospiraceae bacterium]|nr:T9SS type A sorting domain-containing protein [Candidatus Defluviibacterium haderslevense]